LSILQKSSAAIAVVVAFVKGFARMKKLPIIFAATVTLAFGAFADGNYEKTRDGKTTVWNSEPKEGDQATWSGGRDGEGYAKGFGTLTWYSMHARNGRASDASKDKPMLFGRYFGNMVRGKFDGPVNVHAKNQTHYAVFLDGERKTRWSAGPAPSRAWIQHRSLAAAKREKEPQAPAEGPTKANVQRPTLDVQPSSSEADVEAKTAAPSAAPKPASVVAKREVLPNKSAVALPDKKEEAAARLDNSLQLLAGPPSSLRNLPETPMTTTAEAQPRLTSAEVVDLADSATRSHGLNPAEFQRAEPKFDAEFETWSLAYGRSGGDEDARGFSVTVDDKTKGTVFVPAK
jgi:hypothetical protein